MNGEKTVGTFFEAGNASVAEALALTDLDYMLIDTEHGPFDVVLGAGRDRHPGQPEPVQFGTGEQRPTGSPVAPAGGAHGWEPDDLKVHPR